MAEFATTNATAPPKWYDPYAATSGGLGTPINTSASAAAPSPPRVNNPNSGPSNSGGINLFSQNTSFLPFNYASGSSLGSMSLNIPTSFLGGSNNGGGLTFNLDFGPNADTIAKNAYAYDAVQAQNDFAFLGSTIKQTQNFVGGIIQPAITAASSVSNSDFFGNLLSAFGIVTSGTTNTTNSVINSMNTNYQSAIPAMRMNVDAGIAAAQSNAALSNQTAQAAIDASRASIAASQSAAQNSDSGCFITTAVCEYAGESDDCETLSLLRAWRDKFVASGLYGRDCIALYYREAPRIVRGLLAISEERRHVVFGRIRRIVRRAASAVRRGNDGDALIYYVRGIAYAKEQAHV